MRTEQFRMPRDGETFIGSIRERCDYFIEASVWAGMDRAQLRIWINQFNAGAERYFAACILDSLIYRTTKQTVALMEQLLQRAVPDFARIARLDPERSYDWLPDLSHKSGDPGIRIVPVIKDDDPPTKSGPLIARIKALPRC